MKVQKSFLQGLFIAFTFSGIILFCTGCKSGTDQHKQNTGAVKPSVDIHTAVLTGNMEALQQHIAAGSDLNEKDPMGGSSPLITAALFNREDMAKALIDAGANVNFKNGENSTALITAAFFCRKEIVTFLLANGADKTIKNKYGQNAYESVAGPYSTVKEVYEAFGKMFEPMGLKLDYAYIEKTRPEIAAILQ
ncbi:ankyrin repeat domain-containing protein [Gynurincola endophyticus]|uniref:ankyrin repeat domain-containing protein n=1 Tax=Gynurincola endophyticus TaxID=2479004 RepID=UPI000F8DAAF8|nr:ankyrin repeat domain-containing protein [Gynurincola endophyticus]